MPTVETSFDTVYCVVETGRLMTNARLCFFLSLIRFVMGSMLPSTINEIKNRHVPTTSGTSVLISNNASDAMPTSERDSDLRAVEAQILENQRPDNGRMFHISTSSRLCSTLATKISSSVMVSTACTRAPDVS